MPPSRGVILLADVAARANTITITCRICPRHGRRWADHLIAEYGSDMPMPDLLRLLGTP